MGFGVDTMNHEPLKNKIRTYHMQFDMEDGNHIHKMDDDIEVFFTKDVKSAVEGLKEELIEKREQCYRVYKNFGDIKDLELGNGINFAIKLIDKWFEDVIL